MRCGVFSIETPGQRYDVSDSGHDEEELKDIKESLTMTELPSMSLIDEELHVPRE